MLDRSIVAEIRSFRPGNIVERLKPLRGDSFTSIGYYNIETLASDTLNGIDAEEFCAVPIQLHLLEQIFKFDVSGSRKTNSVISLEQTGPLRYKAYFDEMPIEGELLYIHELQNLYLFVTGEELPF
jgi:hypothetical protein